MKKRLTGMFACVFTLLFFAGCATQTPQHIQLQIENAVLRKQIAKSDIRIQRTSDSHWRRYGDPAMASCGVYMLEIVEHTPGNLELVLHICRMSYVPGIVVREQLSESGVYQIDLRNMMFLPAVTFNSLFVQLYPFYEVHALTRVPERLESANITFSLDRASKEIGLTIYSDTHIRIDESRIDMDDLPRNDRDGPYFPNVGSYWSSLIFAIPIRIGD